MRHVNFPNSIALVTVLLGQSGECLACRSTPDGKDGTMNSPLTITRFAGRTASVNSWIVANATQAFVIDALRSESEAAELAETVKATGKTLWGVLVTHGHPDHYIGVRTLKERFPDARVVVAS